MDMVETTYKSSAVTAGKSSKTRPAAVAAHPLRLVNARQVADLLAVHPKSVYVILRDAGVPSIHLTDKGTKRWRLRDVERFIESRALKSLSPIPNCGGGLASIGSPPPLSRVTR